MTQLHLAFALLAALTVAGALDRMAARRPGGAEFAFVAEDGALPTVPLHDLRRALAREA